MENKPSSASASFVDRIIGERFNDNPNIQFRVRVLISSWIFFIVNLVFFGLLTLALPMKPEARLSGFLLSTILAFLLVLMLFTFKRSGNYRLYGNLSVGLAYIAIAISVFLAESPITSPSIGLFYILPMLAVFFLGRVTGLLWLLATIVILGVFFTLEMTGFQFFSVYDKAFLLETRLSSIALGLAGVLGLVITYENYNKKLRLDRDLEYQRLVFLAQHDELTRLSNRASFEEKIEHSIEQLGLDQKNEKLALIYLDLDGFKPINDDYGHKAGDIMLRITADRLQYLLQGKGYAARHGGDEFLLLLEHVQKTEDVIMFVENLLKDIARPVRYENMDLKVTASIGVAFFPKDAQDIVSLMKHADAAMYQAKAHKNNFVFYSGK